MTPSETLGFSAGIPTKPDVDRLVVKYGVPKEDQLIPYDEISDVIHEERRTCRWKTVVHAWRRLLYREHNILLVAVPNVGLQTANPETRVHESSSRYKHGLRRVYFAGDIAAKTQREGLGTDSRRACDHIANATAALRLAAAAQARLLRKPDPIKK